MFYSPVLHEFFFFFFLRSFGSSSDSENTLARSSAESNYRGACNLQSPAKCCAACGGNHATKKCHHYVNPLQITADTSTLPEGTLENDTEGGVQRNAMILHPQDGSGNTCLFHALAFSRQVSGHDLRKSIVQWMQSSPQDKVQFGSALMTIDEVIRSAGDTSTIMPTVQEHAHLMSSRHQQGGLVEIAAFCAMYSVAVVVWEGKRRWEKCSPYSMRARVGFTNRDATGSNIIHLLYVNENHYDALELKSPGNLHSADIAFLKRALGIALSLDPAAVSTGRA